MAAGPGGDRTTHGGELIRLREVPQGQPVRAELFVHSRQERPGLHAGRRGGTIDIEHLIETPKVDGHRAGIAVADNGLDSPDDAGPAAEGDHRRPDPGTPVHDRDELGLVLRMSNQVRRMRELAAQTADNVTIGLPVCVRGPLVWVRSEHVSQRRGRRQPCGGKVKIGEPRRGVNANGTEAQCLPNACGHLFDLLVSGLLILIAPTPELPASHHRHVLPPLG